MADRRVSVNVDADVSAFVRGMMTASAASKAFGSSLKANGPMLVQQEKEIDRYSGRLRLLAEATTTIGPAFIPLGGAAVQALGGLSSGLLAAGAAAGTAMLAFQGVGDGLKALNDYQIDPTAAHLKKVEEAFEKLGPAGEDFVLYLDSIGNQLKSVQNMARARMFPGLEDSIDSLLTRLPQARQIIRNVASELGVLAAEGGEALAGDRWTPFFEYISTDAAPTLRLFAQSVGNVAEGLGSLLVAFAPLNRDFTSGLEDMTQRFADWARTVSQTQGFEEFVDYLRQSGPQAMEFLGAISNALIGIVTAAAPFGSAVLPVLTSLANVLTAIANSPVGGPLFTAAAGFIALNRAVSVFGPGLAKLNEAFLDLRTSPNVAATAAERFGSAMRGLAGAAGVGLFVTSLNESSQGLKSFEAAAGGALAGLAVGGPWGAAVGGAIGLVVSLGHAHEDSSQEVDNLSAAFNRQTGAITENVRAQAVQKAQQDGLLDAAEQLGLKTSTVTNAILGNADAQQRLNDALAGYDVDHSITSVEDLRQSYSDAEIQMILNDRAATKLRDGMPGLTDTFGEAAEQAKQFAGAMGTADGAAKGARRSFHEESIALQKSRDAAAESASNFITLGDSLDDAKVSLSGWIKQLQQQANALEAFGRNAARAAHKDIDQGLIASLEKAGPAGAMRMKQLANASETEIARANKAWRDGQRAIRDYVNIVVPPKKITVDTNGAMSGINNVRNALGELRDKTIHITTIRSGTSIVEPHSQITKAGGGTVPGPRQPYGDKVHALLAPGEEVITNSNGEADRFRADRAAGRIPRYAGGGTVGGGISLDQRLEIAQALGTIRDLKHQLNDRVDKGKNKGDLVTRGIERKILELQLKAAERDLHRAKNADEREAKAKARAKATEDRDKATEARDKKIADYEDKRQITLDGLQSTLDKMQSALDTTIGMRDQLAGGITSGLKSNIWAKRDVDPWAAGAGAPFDPLAALTGDIKNAQRFLDLETSLSGRGLKGGELQEALQNGGLSGLELLSGYSDDQLNQFSSLYAQRESITGQAGAYGGEQVYGQQIADQTAQVASQTQLIANVTTLINAQIEGLRAELTVARAQAPVNQSKYASWIGAAVGKEINWAAASGARSRR